MDKGRVIIAGCGYVGTKLAATLQSENYTVITLVGSVESSEKLEHDYQCYNVDLDTEETLPRMDFTDAIIFYFVPPPSQGISDSRITRFLAMVPPQQKPRKIVMISTTGVYGNCGNDWVDEARTPSPDTDRARRRLDAEQTLQAWCQDRQIDYIILRVPGIYGPGKLPIQRLRERKPVLSLSESPWSNRIHIDDLLQSCIIAMDYTGKHRIFNISDGHPSTMTDFFLSVATAVGLPAPEQISLAQCKQIFSDNMISYLLESKKINNDRMLNELKVQIKFPTLEQGLSGLKSTNTEQVS